MRFNHCMSPTNLRSNITQTRWDRVGFAMDENEIHSLRSSQHPLKSESLPSRKITFTERSQVQKSPKCSVVTIHWWLGSATRGSFEEAGGKGWRIGYVEGDDGSHVSTEYCTIDRVCTVWTDNGDREYAAWVLVVVEVNAVIGGVVGVCIGIGKVRRVVAILAMLTVSEVWRTALTWESALKVMSTWCVR